MVHKPPEPEGKGCLWNINSCPLWFICYILHSDLSLVVINTHGSFHCKQGMLLVNMSGSLHCKQGSL